MYSKYCKGAWLSCQVYVPLTFGMYMFKVSIRRGFSVLDFITQNVICICYHQSSYLCVQAVEWQFTGWHSHWPSLGCITRTGWSGWSGCFQSYYGPSETNPEKYGSRRRYAAINTNHSTSEPFFISWHTLYWKTYTVHILFLTLISGLINICHGITICIPLH